MKTVTHWMLFAALVSLPADALAGSGGARVQPLAWEGTGVSTLGGRAPWSAPWEYDSGGGNDRRPELPYYQQGRGQQTGGPARNLIPDDGLHLFPQ